MLIIFKAFKNKMKEYLNAIKDSMQILFHNTYNIYILCLLKYHIV